MISIQRQSVLAGIESSSGGKKLMNAFPDSHSSQPRPEVNLLWHLSGCPSAIYPSLSPSIVSAFLFRHVSLARTTAAFHSPHRSLRPVPPICWLGTMTNLFLQRPPVMSSIWELSRAKGYHIFRGSWSSLPNLLDGPRYHDGESVKQTTKRFNATDASACAPTPRSCPPCSHILSQSPGPLDRCSRYLP